MKFEKKDIHEIQKVTNSFHDWCCTCFNYDVINKRLLIETEYIGIKGKRIIVFNDVEYFEMIGGDSWGNHPEFPRIIEWCFMLDNTLLCKLKDYFLKQNRHNEHIHCPNFGNLFQTKILLHSGNVIDVMCKDIEIRENKEMLVETEKQTLNK